MSTHKIQSIHAREVLDSRGNPTVEVELTLADGSQGRAIVPSGASKGVHEALELRDGDPKRFLGKGVLKAVKTVEGTIAPMLVGKGFERVQTVDDIMLQADGTTQKSKFGANSMLGVSLAFAHAVARAEKKPLFLTLGEMMGVGVDAMRMPIPLMNIINGGLHADNGLEIQEFMIVPHGFPNFAEALRAGTEVFQHLKKRLHERKLSTTVGDEGGFAPAIPSTAEALEQICQAVTDAGYDPKKQVSLALDAASSSFYSESDKKYKIRSQGKNVQTREEMISFYEGLMEKYPLLSIEDGLEEEDWEGWRLMTQKLGKRVQLVGDDLFVTQPDKVKRGLKEGAANAVLIKVNQVGTLKETFESMILCRENHWGAVASHRSGDTEDITIAHLAVGSGCGQIKTGSLSRSERTAKYNELLRIEDWAQKNRKNIPLAKIF